MFGLPYKASSGEGDGRIIIRVKRAMGFRLSKIWLSGAPHAPFAFFCS